MRTINLLELLPSELEIFIGILYSKLFEVDINNIIQEYFNEPDLLNHSEEYLFKLFNEKGFKFYQINNINEHYIKSLINKDGVIIAEKIITEKNFKEFMTLRTGILQINQIIK